MEFKICSRCVLDNGEVSDIVFDAQGVCQHCLQYDQTAREIKNAKSDLPWIYDRIRKEGRGKEYDCLLGLSGGVDSSTCLHYLIQNGIRPLCFSVDNGWNDPKADENIMRLVEGLKVPFYRYVLDLEKFKELQSAFLKSGVKNIEIPTDHVLMAASYEMAAKHGIKTIIGGGNHSTEGVMPEAYGYQARDLKHIRAIYKKFTGKNLKGVPTISLWGYLRMRFWNGIKIVNLLDYYDYDRAGAVKLLSENLGYKPYGEKHCENTWTWWFQSFYLPIKWKLDKRKPHYSSLINSKQMTRSEALALLRQPHEYPALGIEAKIMAYPKREYWEYPTNKKLWDFLSKLYAIHKRG